MRFQVTQVMDAIERRLTTDITGAQAVVDLGQVIRHVALDRGRVVNLVRIGMLIDALSRYLVDGGAMLYGVVERNMLSEPAMTSKERMVLSRWADEGRIEVTPVVGDRVAEVADLTGLPVIVLRPVPEWVARYPWVAESSGRVLAMSHRAGVATLQPLSDPAAGPPGAGPGDAAAQPAIGRAKLPERQVTALAEDHAPGTGKVAASEAEERPGGTGGPGVTAAEEPAAPGEAEAEADSGAEPAATAEPGPRAEPDAAEPAAPAESEATAHTEPTSGAEPAAEVEPTSEGEPAAEGESAAEAETRTPREAEAPKEPAVAPLPAPVAFFGERGAARTAVTRVSRHRFHRTEPEPAHAHVLRRIWHCDGFDCPAFGDHRQIGQPVPRLRGGQPICPKHDQPVTDAGPRPAAYPVSVVVDDLPRRRVVVRAGQPVVVGREDFDPTDLERLSVARWLHSGAVTWISPVHLRLTATEQGLTVTDLSENGTVVWQRKSPDDPGATMPLSGASYLLGEWDSVELYTGIELVRGDRRLAVVLGRDELESVLVDAPTAAYQQLSPG